MAPHTPDQPPVEFSTGEKGDHSIGAVHDRLARSKRASQTQGAPPHTDGGFDGSGNPD